MFSIYFHLIPLRIFGFAVSFAISVYGVWRARAGVQVYKRELLHTYTLSLGSTRISIMYQKKKLPSIHEPSGSSHMNNPM